MDVQAHTTTLRDRARLSSSTTSPVPVSASSDGSTEAIAIPYLGLVDRRTALYGGAALAGLLLLLLLAGGGRGPVNDGAPIVNIS